MTWWNSLTRQRKFLIGGLGLLVLSQFLTYRAAYGSGTVAMFGLGQDVFGGQIYAHASGYAAVSGWGAHSLAALALAAVLAVQALDLKVGAWWQIWGRLITAILIVLCVFPWSFSHWGFGVYVGAVAGAIAWIGLFGNATPKLPPPNP